MKTPHNSKKKRTVKIISKMRRKKIHDAVNIYIKEILMNIESLSTIILLQALGDRERWHKEVRENYKWDYIAKFP